MNNNSFVILLRDMDFVCGINCLFKNACFHKKKKLNQLYKISDYISDNIGINSFSKHIVFYSLVC